MDQIIERFGVISIGLVLDLCFGDPHWLYHPVQGIGMLISGTEKLLRSLFGIRESREADKGKKRMAGAVLAVIVLCCSVGIPAALLFAAERVSHRLYLAVSAIICYQLLAMRSLKKESMKVYTALQEGNLCQARYAVSRIVGRDTANLDREGIIRAAVETVAENTSDGVIAPLLFMLLFGPVGGFFYKAVNTMDSMLGYRNDTYCYLGTAAARLDDLVNLIPARVSAVFMIAAGFLCRLDWKNAIRIYRRDRYRHKSPNAAQTESVCAGALDIQLAGDSMYFGKLVKKPVIGDPMRPVETEDIRRANRLFYVTSFLVWGVGSVLLFLLHVG
ncbi:MAG: adenosylcobinamide-phosphate synthase CbiB [Clostridiaceae bacterium]|nr:adenosylcobinamide-phosphate synthase CbiB [Clostridiaceae bacterium]